MSNQIRGLDFFVFFIIIR